MASTATATQIEHFIRETVATMPSPSHKTMNKKHTTAFVMKLRKNIKVFTDRFRKSGAIRNNRDVQVVSEPDPQDHQIRASDPSSAGEKSLSVSTAVNFSTRLQCSESTKSKNQGGSQDDQIIINASTHSKDDDSGHGVRVSDDASNANCQEHHKHHNDKITPVKKKRSNIFNKEKLGDELTSFDKMKKEQRLRDWAAGFRRSDPRYQILTFFNDVAQEGAADIEDQKKAFRPEMISPLLRPFYKASVFTVWRPTSYDAIRKMMLGEAVGKSLDIKGKSAKRGKFSALVPFLQIHLEADKKKIRTLSSSGRVRVFFGSQKERDTAMKTCQLCLEQMLSTVQESRYILDRQSEYDDVKIETACQNLLLQMDDPTICHVDACAPKSYGIDLPERLLWQSFVAERDISRTNGSEYDGGRPSEPNFQDMNNASLRKKQKPNTPKAVLWRYTTSTSSTDPMNPLDLVMAYEENGRVLPVVSDFDCFLMGTRGVAYTSPMSSDEMDVLNWCVSQMEVILENKTDRIWTSRWLDQLKSEAKRGYTPMMPELGYSDPKSHSIMKHAISRLAGSGAVRHGAESFNYFFPQDLDDEFLVISDNLSGHSLPWKYVNVEGLQEILLDQIDAGYTFPLNPKWILCDQGWKNIYDRLCARKTAEESMKIWYPPILRARIEDIHKRHPDGFQKICNAVDSYSSDNESSDEKKVDGSSAMDLAGQELKRFMTLQRAKSKL
uniref:Uncharacterized protein n=1 Tax=Asterionellopsis glacialis TaxID=33640 RepID=A0A7S0L037_9STRA|mmetsp:Transcript_90/g.123  ORF Transcript_90/g.123 Transcript_90/m.123 type:complete len:724 (+) Transcript_90:125-2296(+)